MFLLFKCTIGKNKKANYMIKNIFSAALFVAITAIPGYAGPQNETQVQDTLSPEGLVILAFRENIPLPGNVSLIDALEFIASKMEGVNAESKEFLQELRVQIQQNHDNTEALTEILKKMREAFKNNQFVFFG